MIRIENTLHGLWVFPVSASSLLAIKLAVWPATCCVVTTGDSARKTGLWPANFSIRGGWR